MGAQKLWICSKYMYKTSPSLVFWQKISRFTRSSRVKLTILGILLITNLKYDRRLTVHNAKHSLKMDTRSHLKAIGFWSAEISVCKEGYYGVFADSHDDEFWNGGWCLRWPCLEYICQGASIEDDRASSDQEENQQAFNHSQFPSCWDILPIPL